MTPRRSDGVSGDSGGADREILLKQAARSFFREARDLIIAFRSLLAAVAVIGVSIWGAQRVARAGVGENCTACRAACAALGRELGTETRFAAGRCWVKQWSQN